MKWFGPVDFFAGQPLRPALQEAKRALKPPEIFGRFLVIKLEGEKR